MLCFSSQNTVSFHFSAPDLRFFIFFHGTSYKSSRFSCLSLSGKYRPLLSWRCRRANRLFKQAHLHTHTDVGRETLINRALKGHAYKWEGMESRADRKELASSCHCALWNFHTFFRVGAVLITVLVGVSKAVFLLVGRYIKQKRLRCFCVFGARCYQLWFNIFMPL